jgi:uracil-DNA glycosylase
MPLVGNAGKLLFEVLGEAMPDVEPELHAEIRASFRYDLAWVRRRHEWLEAAGVGKTNVLAFQPPQNKLDFVGLPKGEPGAMTHLPPFRRSPSMLYLDSRYAPELDRLRVEIEETRPNLIVCLGNMACWAVLQATNISSIRGTIAHGAGAYRAFKCLPTYHPAAIFRMWSWRPILVADLMKAHLEGQFPQVVRPQRSVLVNPTLGEIETIVRKLEAAPPDLLSADIETGAGQIKCISFAWSISESLCIPFVDLRQRTGCYWPTLEDELLAWSYVRRLLALPCAKLGQNFIYDLQYITRMGILPAQCTEDTMLLHHSLYPELQKGLGFLASIYSNEASWKLMNRRKTADVGVKADE